MLNTELINEMVDNNREEATAFLVECLQTPSVTGDESAMGKVISRWMEKIGLEPHNYEKEPGRSNIVGEWIGSKPGKTFLFNGHMDVFPPVPGNPGKYGPWSGKIVDEYIYGRGSIDMKAGLCASILAVKYLKELNYPLEGNVLITCVSDEENGGNLGTKYLLDEGIIHGDAGVCMEATGKKIIVEHCGGIIMKVTYRGEAINSAFPHPTEDSLSKAINAILKLKELDKKLQQHYFMSGDLKVSSLLSVTMMNAGEAENMFAAESSFIIDRRLLPDETVEEAIKEIEGVLDKLQEEKKEYDYKYEYEILTHCSSLTVDRESDVVKAAQKAFKDIAGYDTRLHRTGGGSDASSIAEVTGMNIPNFGPGWDGTEGYGCACHEDERLILEDYFMFIKIYMKMLVYYFSQAK